MLQKYNIDVLSKLSTMFKVRVSDITSVLEVNPVVEYRGNERDTFTDMFEMIDMFYANKHMYERLKNRDI